MKYFLYCRKSTEDDTKQIQSIEDQISFMLPVAEKRGISKADIVEVLEEKKSAKKAGRPVFNDMMERIRNGEAQGIICWKLDRLARNWIDGGTIIDMLQRGAIQEIVTHSQTHLPSDNVLLMSVEFGMANQYIRDLSVGVKRGMRSQTDKGWRPNLVPTGYLNNKMHLENSEGKIIPDPKRFHLVRKMWEYLLTSAYTINKIRTIANEEWGYRTVQRRKSGGKPIGHATLYHVFTNPFYCGRPLFLGEQTIGKYPAMVTEEEFIQAQRILGRKGYQTKPSKREFAFGGLLRCGECGCTITGEAHTKRLKTSGEIKTYNMYRCVKKNRKGCTQKYSNERELETMVNEYVETLAVDDQYITWSMKWLSFLHKQECTERETIETSLTDALTQCKKRIDNLFQMKLRELVTDEEYTKEKQTLLKEKEQLEQETALQSDRQNNWLQTAEQAMYFCRDFKTMFDNGNLQQRKILLKQVGAHLVLNYGKLHIEAQKPFKSLLKLRESSKGIDRSLEPNVLLVDAIKKGTQGAEITKWWAIQDLNL